MSTINNKCPVRKCPWGAQLNDELSFLINCCQTNPSAEEIEFILTSLLTINHAPSGNALGVQRIIKLANQHGILPLVYKTLKKLQPDGSSKNHEILSTLKQQYLSVAQRNMLMSAELIRIMKLLEDNGIEALAFKGPALAQMAYGDITLRQYVDLDILVDEKDVSRAGKILLAQGYQPINSIEILDNKICREIDKDFSFMNNSRSVHIELHWRLFEERYNITFDSKDLDNATQTLYINNRDILTLSNELLLVYLCLHGAKHAFERIEWICDIDRLIRSQEIDWKQAEIFAGKTNALRSYRLGLELCRNIFNTPIENIIKSKEILELYDLTLQRISSENGFSKKEHFFYQMQLFESTGEKFRFFMSTFLKITTTDCQTFVLPEKLKFLYIILRPMRLLLTYLHLWK